MLKPIIKATIQGIKSGGKAVAKAAKPYVEKGQKIYNNTPVGNVLSFGGRNANRRIQKWGVDLANKLGADRAVGTLGEKVALGVSKGMGNAVELGGQAAFARAVPEIWGAARDAASGGQVASLEDYVSPTGSTFGDFDPEDEEFQRFKNQAIFGIPMTDEEYEELAASGGEVPKPNMDVLQQFFETVEDEDGNTTVEPRQEVIKYWLDTKDSSQNLYNEQGGWLDNFSLDPTGLFLDKSLSSQFTDWAAGGSPEEAARKVLAQELQQKASIRGQLPRMYQGDEIYGAMRESERAMLQDPFANQGLNVRRGARTMLEAMNRPQEDIIHDEDYDTLQGLMSDSVANQPQIAELLNQRPELLKYFPDAKAAELANTAAGMEGRNSLLYKAGYEQFARATPSTASTTYAREVPAAAGTTYGSSYGITPPPPSSPLVLAPPAGTASGSRPTSGFFPPTSSFTPPPSPLAPTRAAPATSPAAPAPSAYGPSRFTPSASSGPTATPPAGPAAVSAAAASPTSAVSTPAVLGPLTAPPAASPDPTKPLFGLSRFTSGGQAATPTQTPAPTPTQTAGQAKSPVDYLSQRYSGMTQDQMMTEWQNDAIKRRMGYTSEPMNPQLAAFGKAYGRDEGQFSAALNRAAQNTAPNPWDKAVKPANWNDEVDGPWDVAEATAAKRIRMGLIPSDSMPNVKMSTGPTQIGPFSLDIPNRTDMAQQYDAQANRTGIRDSRQRKIWEERDAAVRNLGQLGETLSTVINPFSRKNK